MVYEQEVAPSAVRDAGTSVRIGDGLHLPFIHVASRNWIDSLMAWQIETRQHPYRELLAFRLFCPECYTILDSLAFHYPDIADEWSPMNSVSPWHIRPNTSQLVEPPR